MRGQAKSERGRGLGPFTGGQLSIIVVAICAVFALPTAALAAAGAFSNNSATVPAVTGTNSNAHGIGVQGNGTKYGVYSNGPLGVAAGKPLRCTGCVAPTALSAAAKTAQPLAHGESETGVFAAWGGDSTFGNLGDSITFAQPLATPIPDANIVNGFTSPHCSKPGAAAAGYLCIYVSSANHVDLTGMFGAFDVNLPTVGAAVSWPITGTFSQLSGEWTLTAP